MAARGRAAAGTADPGRHHSAADSGPRRRRPAHRHGADHAHRCGQPQRVRADDHAQPSPGRRERTGGPGDPGDRLDPDAGPGSGALAGDARLGPAECGRRLQSAVRGAAGGGRAVHRGHRRPPCHPPRADHLRPGQPLCERALHRGLRPTAHRPPPGARKKTPTDKPLPEHFFVTLAHRFSQHVTHGWQGRSHKKRGRGIDRMPLYTIAELQQMAQEWVALEYQQTPTRGCATRSGQASCCRPTRCTRSRWPAAATGRCRSPRPEPLLPAAAVGHPRQGWLHDRLSDLSAHRAGRRPLPGDPPARRLEAARPGEAVGMPLQPLPSRAGVVVRPHGRHLGDLRFPAPAPAARSVDRGHVAGTRRAAPYGRRKREGRGGDRPVPGAA